MHSNRFLSDYLKLFVIEDQAYFNLRIMQLASCLTEILLDVADSVEFII